MGYGSGVPRRCGLAQLLVGEQVPHPVTVMECGSCAGSAAVPVRRTRQSWARVRLGCPVRAGERAMIAHQVIDGAAAAQAGPGARARILVIDDEQAIRSALSRALEAEGFRIDSAETGSDGLRRALADAYNLRRRTEGACTSGARRERAASSSWCCPQPPGGSRMRRLRRPTANGIASASSGRRTQAGRAIIGTGNLPPATLDHDLADDEHW